MSSTPWQRRPLVRVLFLLLVVLVTFFALRRILGPDFDAGALRGEVERMGIWGPVIFVAIMMFRIPLLVPSYLALSVGGAIFGTVAGTLYGALGLLLSAVAAYLSGRWSRSDASLARLPARYAAIVDVARSRFGAALIALGTGHPLTPSVMTLHLLAGMTGMAAALFIIAAAIGCLVRAGLYAYFGDALVNGELDGTLRAGGLLLVAAVLPLAFPAFRTWLRHGSVRTGTTRTF